jgi:Ran GTPase-activating protein (RanGAP) involved in mRNA processing and transport
MSSSSPLASSRLPFGLTHEQLYTELYGAWRKDVREGAANAESQNKFRELMEKGLREKGVVLRAAHIGVNVSLSLASLLSRSNVVKVDLYQNIIQDAGCEAVAHLVREAPSLTHVNLGANDIGPPGVLVLAAVVAAHKRLQVLILGSTSREHHVNRIDPAAGKTLLEACIRCKTLKVLDLTRNPLGRGSQEAFPLVGKLVMGSATLQVLRLGETEMSNESGLLLAQAVARSPSLAELDVSTNHLTHRVGAAFAQLFEERARRSSPSALKSLFLHATPLLGERGAGPLFRSLSGDRGLSTLTLHSSCVDDEAVLQLCDALDSNGVLTHLDLHTNNITDAGATELARALVGHPALQYLGLARNKVRDDGACALAAMLEHNKTVDTLDLDEAWVGDRGAVALGVALSGNTTLHTLRLAGNHISEDGGAALIALLDKNKAVQACSLKGNGIFHNTMLQGARVVDRNKKAREDEVPNKLKREVVRLHYQLYKLEEAKAELKTHRQRKEDVEAAQERFELQFREDEMEYHRHKKELEDSHKEQEHSCKSLEESLVTMKLTFDRFVVSNDADVQLFTERLDAEVAERVKAEEELARVQGNIANAEGLRAEKVAALHKKIEDAKEDRDRWVGQTKEYRSKAEQAQGKLDELQAQSATDAAAAAARKAEGKASKDRKKSTAAAAQKDIASLLAAQQADA